MTNAPDVWRLQPYTRQVSERDALDMFNSTTVDFWFPRAGWFSEEEVMLRVKCKRCGWSVRTDSDPRTIIQHHWFNCEGRDSRA